MKSHVSAIGVFVSKANPLNQIGLDRLDAIYSEARRRGYPILRLGVNWDSPASGPTGPFTLTASTDATM
jgi:hypothetical protein